MNAKLFPMAATPSELSAQQAAPIAAEPMRLRIAKQILIYHIILIVVAFVLFIARGFDGAEFTSLMGMLGPVTAVYAGAVYRFLGRSITNPQPIENQSAAGTGTEPVNKLVRWLVHGHFVAILGLITLSALFKNVLNFQELTLGLTLVESAVGAYMGSVLLALFEGKEK